MHRRTFCENVYQNKGNFLYYRYRYFTRGIDVSSYIVSIHIDESLHPYTASCLHWQRTRFLLNPSDISSSGVQAAIASDTVI